jgi:hypothetical protein
MADASVLGADLHAIDISRHDTPSQGEHLYFPRVASTPQRRDEARNDSTRAVGAPQALPENAGLAGVIDAWDRLPEEVRLEIVQIVKASARPLQ